jgi:hypothetical protein
MAGLLGRVLISRWHQQLESLAVELTRTIGFAEQQSGLAVGSVWLFGAGRRSRPRRWNRNSSCRSRSARSRCSPFYWAEQAAKLPEKDDGNLISLEARQAPQRRRLSPRPR